MTPAQPAYIDAAALQVIRKTPSVLRGLLLDLPDEVTRQANDEGWSVADVVAHLCDVEGVAFTERIQRMLDEERPVIRSIDPPARLAAADYASRSLDQLLVELEAVRAAHADWLGNLDVEQLRRTGQHDEVGEIRVVDIAHQWAAHDLNHLRQIAHMLQEHMAPLMGATRAFYDV